MRNRLLLIVALMLPATASLAEKSNSTAQMDPLVAADLFMASLESPSENRPTIGERLELTRDFMPGHLYILLEETFSEVLAEPLPPMRFQRERPSKLIVSQGGRIVSLDLYEDHPRYFARIGGHRLSDEDMEKGETALQVMEAALRSQGFTQNSPSVRLPWVSAFHALLLPSAEAFLSGQSLSTLAGVAMQAFGMWQARRVQNNPPPAMVPLLPTSFGGTQNISPGDLIRPPTTSPAGVPGSGGGSRPPAGGPQGQPGIR